MKTISYICVFIFQLAFIKIRAVGEDTITLKKCYQALENNHPVTKQTGIYEDINKLKSKDIQSLHFALAIRGNNKLCQRNKHILLKYNRFVNSIMKYRQSQTSRFQ